MINNRQNGRRRGRGGGQGAPPRNGSSGGGQDRGNRIDNRARGNAAQLHEKYKALARDAQMQGDRVNTEYYLQFADHYFRVLSESRSRFEEQQPRPRRDDYANQSDEDYGDEGERIGNDDRQAPEPIFAMRETDAQRDFGDRETSDGNRGDGNRGNRDNGNRGDGHRRASNRDDVRSDGNRNEASRGDANRGGGNRDDVNHADGNRGDGERGEETERRPRRGRPPRAEQGQVAAEQRPAPVELSLGPVVDSRPPVQDVASAEEEQRPVRRRGRPPKAQPAEQIEVDRLPPSLSLKTPVEDGSEGGDRPRPRTRKPRGESAVA